MKTHVIDNGLSGLISQIGTSGVPIFHLKKLYIKVKLYTCIEKKKHTKYTVSLIFIIFHFAFLKFCSQNARVKFLHPLLMISKDFEIKIATIPNTNRKH